MKSQARLRLRQPVEPKTVMVRIGPATWRCRCGANVLTQIGNIFHCNGCGECYESVP